MVITRTLAVLVAVLIVLVQAEASIQGTKKTFRKDGKCGPSFLLPDNRTAECDAAGASPCCNLGTGDCGSEDSDCYCSECVDFRIVEKARESGGDCVVGEFKGFLRKVCYNETNMAHYFKCIHTDVSFKPTMEGEEGGFSGICEEDPHFYQACGFIDSDGKTSTQSLCGGYVCVDSIDETKVEVQDYPCKSITDLTNLSCSDLIQSEDFKFEIPRVKICASFGLEGDQSSEPFCEDFLDQTNCLDVNRVGGYCEVKGIQSTISKIMVCGGNKQLCDDNSENNCIDTSSNCRVHKHRLCDGEEDCADGSDEIHKDCQLMTNNQKCIRKFGILQKNMTFPHSWIKDDKTDCLDGLDEIEENWASCLDNNFAVQTNCSDVDLVGGHCEVNGFRSTISKFMVCGKNMLCDDNSENNCIDASSSCRVHKHRLCDGEDDCEDRSDETHDDCQVMTKDQRCVRRFGSHGLNSLIPHSWLLDDEWDCLDNKMDEDKDIWKSCPGETQIVLKNVPCETGDEIHKDVCDGKCDTEDCVDESFCHGTQYGMECTNTYFIQVYLPVEKICDGNSDCVDDGDDCTVTSETQSCAHYRKNHRIVPIHDYTRCAIFNLQGEHILYPYCADFEDQTNCLDTNRVGGYCEVKGIQSTISKIMVCGGNKQLCDDNSENNCIDTSSNCRVHKHRLCDGEKDCQDVSDENNDDCKSMTKDQKCIRKFGILEKNMTFPHSWIMDNKTDCLDGLDEIESKWNDCLEDVGIEIENTILVCDNKCDTNKCEDEGYCNSRSYGMACKNSCNMRKYLPVQQICDGNSDCEDGVDETNCESDDSEVASCVHFQQKQDQNVQKSVVIQESVRCAIFDMGRSPALYPYCADFEDQTNCSDTNRVGGYCEVNGFQSSISKIMVCGGNKQLCDDNSENNCIDTSSNCRVHKHRLCDGEDDCEDGSDENNNDCNSMTKDQTCVRKFGINEKSLPFPHTWIMDNEPDCLDGLDEMEHRWDDCLGSISKDTYDSSLSCDGECDTDDCKDESDCNNQSYGMVCKNRCNMRTYLPVKRICNGSPDCSDGVDEENCELDESAVPTCVHFEQKEKKSLEKVVPINNWTRCAIFDLSARPPVYPYCTNFEDQTNCSDTNRVGGYCEVKGFQSTVSKTMVCGGNKQLCDDNSENNCIDASSSCRVHKHRLCDGEEDCEDGSDETLDICNSEPKNVTCVRKFGIPGKSTTIPSTWVNDNELDCLDGLDEDMWNRADEQRSYSCGNETYRIKAGRVNKCRKSFVCPGVDNENLVKIELFCDSKESCGGRENEVCETSKDFLSTKRIIEIAHESAKDLCRKTNTSVCQESEFDYHAVDIFGVERTKLYLPSEPIDCSDKFGEHYVYLSCMDLCDNTTCPLKSNALKQDSCPGQYSDRIFTLANNSYLTFVTKSEGRYHNDFFECDNGHCVNFSQVCDLIDDCGDMSDESNCKNHFTCEGDDKLLLGFEQKCDGVYDCHDLSDECNDSCGKLIISDLMLTRLCWSIGAISILLSCRTLVSVLQGMKQSLKYEKILYTKVLLMLVIAGNLMMAVYVITLSIYDIMYGAELCREQAHWLTSAKCSALGIVSTIGTELSIFSLTFLTILRLYNVSNRSAIVPVTKSSVSKITLWTTLIIVAAVVVALIPLTPGESFENYFTQGYFYEEDYKLFTGFNSKVKHVNILETYYSNGNSLANITTDMRWKEISALVEGMFTNDYGNLTVNRVHFYGNDKICLFKYILRPEETMVYQHGNVLTWIVLTLNSVCFLVMLIAVVWICIVREQSSKKGDPKNSEHDRTRYFERLILVIVLSDLLCWTPFAIICTLHNLNIADVSSWYNIMSLTLLPLNAVLNPLICLIKMGVKKLFNLTLQETFQRFPGVKKGEPRLGTSTCTCKGKCNCNIAMNSVAPISKREGVFANPTWIPLATDIESDTAATEQDIEPDTTV